VENAEKGEGGQLTYDRIYTLLSFGFHFIGSMTKSHDDNEDNDGGMRSNNKMEADEKKSLDGVNA
jgi:hypothetical protein